MVELNAPDDMSEVERRRVMREIEAIKRNEMKVGKELEDYDESEFIDLLASMDSQELADTWFGFVGEWLQTRSDLDFGGDFEEWIETQWNNLLSGKEQEYFVEGQLSQHQVRTLQESASSHE